MAPKVVFLSAFQGNGRAVAYLLLFCFCFFLPAPLHAIDITVDGPFVFYDIGLYHLGDPQGLTYHPLRKSFFVVTKNPVMLHEIDHEGRVVQSISLAALTGAPEDISYDTLTQTMLICKGSPTILQVASDGTATAPGRFLTLPFPIEADGIAIHPLTGNIFLSDHATQRIVEVDRFGTLLRSFDTAPFGVKEPQGLAFFGTDLLIADDEESTSSIYRFTESGEFVQKVLLTTSFGVEDPEGIVSLAEDRICIIGDSDGLLLCFDNPHDSISLPFSLGIEDTFVGFSAVNSEKTSNALNVYGYTESGRNPVFDQLVIQPPGGQIGQFTDELVAWAPEKSAPSSALRSVPEVPVAWNGATGEPLRHLALHSRFSSVQALFMAGDLSGLRLDGIGAQLTKSRHLVFPEAMIGTSEKIITFLMNPNASSAKVTLTLRDLAGKRLGTGTVLLAPFGSSTKEISSFFGSVKSLADGYIEASSETPFIGFELRASPLSFSMLAGQSASMQRFWLAPHFYAAGSASDTLFRILNLGEEPAQISLRAYDPDSVVLAESQFQLRSREVRAGSAMNLLPAGMVGGEAGSAVGGFLEFESHGPQMGPFEKPSQVVATLSYRGNNGDTFTSLPFSPRGRAETIVPFVAHSSAASFSQGLVLMNPTSRTANVILRYSDREGRQSNISIFTLEPRQRVVGLLNQPPYFGATFDQMGGHLRVSASEPILSTSFVSGPRFVANVETHSLAVTKSSLEEIAIEPEEEPAELQ